jgi:stage III sporulation protein SpoIIIAA
VRPFLAPGTHRRLLTIPGAVLLSALLEIVLDLGRRPEARFLEVPGGEELRDTEVTYEELEAAEAQLGSFGADNRAGLTGTLHRISCIRNRRGKIIGLTCRVGRAVTGHGDMIRDLLDSSDSLLLLGRPGVGKTTVIRELARILSDDFHKRVVIIDTSSEIGGDGDVPHPAIGSARRMQVADPSQQHHLMIEAVENHMPESACRPRPPGFSPRRLLTSPRRVLFLSPQL